MEWLKELYEKFKDDEEIKDLKEDRFFGHLTINFFEGRIVDLNKYQTRKPIVR